jgi:hypothetical protein
MNKTSTAFRRAGPFLAGYLPIVWLWRFGWAHWPAATDIAACVAGGLLAIVYVWKFFIVPFRKGLKGSPDR